MKVPTLTGTNFEEYGLAFTATVRRKNDLIKIPLDYFIGSDAVVNYDAAWNYREEKLKFCANLRGKSFNDGTETLYNILVQYFGTSGTGRNNVSCHTMSKNGHMCYFGLKGHFKTENYEGKKASKGNAIIQSAHYDGNRKFTLGHY